MRALASAVQVPACVLFGCRGGGHVTAARTSGKRRHGASRSARSASAITSTPGRNGRIAPLGTTFACSALVGADPGRHELLQGWPRERFSSGIRRYHARRMSGKDDTSRLPERAEDAQPLIRLGLEQPSRAFPAILRLAAHEDWRVREVAATVLVRVGKKHAATVVAELAQWTKSADENVRRASSEGLRGIARVDAKLVIPILDELRHDHSAYVRKSVANILRDASKQSPELVASTCVRWLRGASDATRWIIRNGVKKLPDDTQRSILSKLV